MRRVLTLIFALLLVGATACGGDDTAAGDQRPSIVVTTTILGDVVTQLAGDLVDVEVVMPLGADPHEFAASARQAEAMAGADLLVVNGAGFEAGMTDVIDAAADTAPVFVAADHVELLRLDGDDDPHLWTDPTRVADVAQAFGAQLAEIDGVDAAALGPRVEAYLAELATLDAGIEQVLSAVPAGQRALVTDHEVFGYFADRYDFEVLGAVIPSLTTGAEASAADLEELATTITDAGVPTIFTETTSPGELAAALADEVGDVSVVALYAESLGEPGSGAETYVGMMRTNAELIADGLA